MPLPVQEASSTRSKRRERWDEIRTGTKNSDQPAENVSKQRNHGKESYLMASVRRLAKELIPRVYEVLTRDSLRSPREHAR